MAYAKGGYPPLIGGVTQQVVQARLPNQVTAQVNMLSDLVTGPRRRGGFRLVRELDVAKEVVTEVVVLDGEDALISVEYLTGRVKATSLVPGGAELVSETLPYLVATSPQSIRFVQHSNDIYILNTEQTVTLGTPNTEKNIDPANLGYFYVNSGALNTTYDVVIDVAGVSHTITHSTPTTPATSATPTFISGQLMAAMQAHAVVGTAQGYVYTQLGPYIFIKAPVPIRVTTSLGSHILQVSNSSNVKDSATLPAKLPVAADGYVVRIGYGIASQYFEWDYADSAWKERSAYAQSVPLTQLPVFLRASDKTISQITMVGRVAGDTENSPDPHFVGKKLTGLGSFQGRLLYLCGEYLTFSASNEVGRCYRASMSNLVADDPIEIASTTTLGVSYEYAVPHNGDLLVTAENVQGLVPGRTVLTPNNAVISIAAQYKMQSGVKPSSTGKSMLYPAQSSVGTSAIWEMTPSEYTEQQIQAQNITEHLPRFVTGSVRGITTSNTSGIAVILDGTNTLKLHQYLWRGVQKVHTAFHEWESREEILSVHLQINLLYMLSRSPAGSIRILEWDIVNGLGDQWKTVPKLDSYSTHSATAGTVSIPAWMYTLDELRAGTMLAYMQTPEGTPFAFSITDWVDAGSSYTGNSKYILQGALTLGYTYKSSITPSPPVLRDYQGTPILTERAILHSVTASFTKTGILWVDVKDRARQYGRMQYTPLKMYSNDLDAGEPLATEGTVNIPMRTDMPSTEFTISTEDIYDMNITVMEFGYKHNQRGRRAFVGVT